MAGKKRTDGEPEDLISTSQLMQLLDGDPEPAGADDRTYDAEPPPKITRMPAGIEVQERKLGHAIGQWVVQIRCDCGRRWFEVEPVKTSDCPRCGALVLIDIEP